MKKLCHLLVALSIFTDVYSQLTPSTLGQVFNLAVGDSFEYTNTESEYVSGGGDEYFGYDLLIVDSVMTKAAGYYYYCSATRITVHSSNGGYGTSPQPWDYRQPNSEIIDTSSSAYFIVTAPDSSIFSIYDTVGNLSTDEISDTSQYHGRKQNSYSSAFGEASLAETYVEGIGLTNRSVNSYGTSDYVQLMLIYYHKADGELWGSYTTFPLAVNEVPLPELKAKISPNPITEQFQLTLSVLPSQKLYLNIFDVAGKEIRQEEVHSAINTYQRSNLSAGSYFWQLASGSNVYYRGIFICR